jgi:glutamine synthetase
MTDHNVAHDDIAISLRQSELQDAGVRLVIGTTVNASGITLAKSVPVARFGAFHRSGMGAAPVWNVFTIDGGIAFTDDISPVGDMRLRIDLDALRLIGGARAWAPGNFYNQDGTPSSTCSRGALERIEKKLADAGYEALVGHELEFFLVNNDGSRLEDSPWVPYGMTGLLERAGFVDDLLVAMNEASIQLEQFHSEYGRNQFEFSLPPVPPVEAADLVVLAKTIVGIVARSHDLRASFSPAPFPGDVGNGAHQHFSLAKKGESLFSDGEGPHGITTEGGSAIAGIIAGLPDIQGFLTGSILSGSRLAPGSWSGAFACWGLENREASVRFLTGGPSNPRGANVEVKIVDPAANVYLASAAILALALEGIGNGASLPAEVAGDPGRLSDAERTAAGIGVLSADPVQIIDVLDGSQLARRLLGDDIVDITVAVRRYEQKTFAEATPEELAERFRLAWSI